MSIRVAKKMTSFRFRTACLLGIVALASARTSGYARRSPPEVPSLPHVNEITPLGVRRGFASRLTVRGSALSGIPRLIAPFRFAVETPTPNDSDAATFKVRITDFGATHVSRDLASGWPLRRSLTPVFWLEQDVVVRSDVGDNSIRKSINERV